VFAAPFAALTCGGGVPSPNAAPAPAILARLTLGETSVGKLAAPFDMSLPGISKHLKVLGYRRHWEQRLDRLDDYLQELQTKGRKRGRTKK